MNDKEIYELGFKTSTPIRTIGKMIKKLESLDFKPKLQSLVNLNSHCDFFTKEAINYNQLESKKAALNKIF